METCDFYFRKIFLFRKSMLNPQNIVLIDINELKVKVVLTLLTISKFANLGQEIQRV